LTSATLTANKQKNERLDSVVPRAAGRAQAGKRNVPRGKFDIVMVWAFDRMARSVRHFLEVLDELNHLQIEFVSFRENIDTGGPLGRALVVIIGAIAELERNLIIERIRAGSRDQPFPLLQNVRF